MFSLTSPQMSREMKDGLIVILKRNPPHLRPFASEENTIIKLFDNLLNPNKF